MTENPEFDHLLHYVPSVESAVEAYQRAGLPAHVNDVVTGFQNGGWRLDERYVEILTVTDRAALQASRYARAFTLLQPAIDALDGPGGAITFAVNVTDARAAADRLRGNGFRVEESEIELTEHGVSFVEIFVLDGPSWLPFLITYTPPRSELLAAVPPGAFTRGPHDLTGIVIETPDPDASARLLNAVLGVERLAGFAVTFERGEREAITAMTLSGGESRATTVVDGLALRFAS